MIVRWRSKLPEVACCPRALKYTGINARTIVDAIRKSINAMKHNGKSGLGERGLNKTIFFKTHHQTTEILTVVEVLICAQLLVLVRYVHTEQWPWCYLYEMIYTWIAFSRNWNEWRYDFAPIPFIYIKFLSFT